MRLVPAKCGREGLSGTPPSRLTLLIVHRRTTGRLRVAARSLRTLRNDVRPHGKHDDDTQTDHGAPEIFKRPSRVADHNEAQRLVVGCRLVKTGLTKGEILIGQRLIHRNYALLINTALRIADPDFAGIRRIPRTAGI